MATETKQLVKEVEALGRRRSALVAEAERLREEGAQRQIQNQPVGELASRLEDIDGELRALNFDFKAWRRSAAGARVKELATDAEFQKAVAVLAPLAELGRAVRARRGAGFALPSLPPMLERISREADGYLEEVRRRGGVGK